MVEVMFCSEIKLAFSVGMGIPPPATGYVPQQAGYAPQGYAPQMPYQTYGM